MLCGPTEANDARRNITVDGAMVPNYVFRHATLVFKFDEAADLVYLADPARPEEKGRFVGVGVDRLVRGFDDVKVSELGPNARQTVPAGMTDVRVRLYRLDRFVAA